MCPHIYAQSFTELPNTLLQGIAQSIEHELLNPVAKPKCEHSQVASVVGALGKALGPLLDATLQEQTWKRPEQLLGNLDACSVLLHVISSHLMHRTTSPLVHTFTPSVISSLTASGLLGIVYMYMGNWGLYQL